MNKPKTKVDELKEALKKKNEAEAKLKQCEAAAAAPIATAPTSAASEKSADDISEQIRAAEEEARGHYDKLLRVMAEFENFKKRMKKEHDEQLEYANHKLLTELLPGLDDLDRMLDHVPPDASNEVRQFADGIELARKSLLATLERFGLKEVPAIGEPFDPAKHEAIATVESDSCEPGHVLAVHRKGYWLGERLLRPAMVTVAKAVTHKQGGEIPCSDNNQ